MKYCCEEVKNKKHELPTKSVEVRKPDTIDLLDCPFCRGEVHFVVNDTVLRDYEKVSPDEHVWDIECRTERCFMAEGAGWCLTQKLLAKKWNTRNHKTSQTRLNK